MTPQIKIRKKSGRTTKQKNENLGKKELAATARQRLSNTNKKNRLKTITKYKQQKK